MFYPFIINTLRIGSCCKATKTTINNTGWWLEVSVSVVCRPPEYLWICHSILLLWIYRTFSLSDFQTIGADWTTEHGTPQALYDSAIIYKISWPHAVSRQRDLNTGHGEHWLSELFVSSSFLINSSTALSKKTPETILRIEQMESWVGLKMKNIETLLSPD